MDEFYPDYQQNNEAAGADISVTDAIEESKEEPVSAVENPVPVQWYGVAYQGVGGGCRVPQKPKRRVGAFIALIVACCLLLTTIVGLCGYLIADFLTDNDKVTGDELFQNPSGTPSTNIPGGTVTGEGGETVTPDAPVVTGDVTKYPYADVVIPKNDGSTLVGSVNGSAGDGGKSLIAAIAEVRDSVVEIFTQTVSSYGQLRPAAGSGVIIHADGIIVTNNHVVEGAKNIYVRLTDGTNYEAYLRGTDEETDIAILKIAPTKALTVARLGSSKSLALGESVFAIGNPLGQLGGTVTNGIISALEREVKMEENLTMTLIQTNAAINSGNSGGGLFNMAGELIGVVNAKISDSASESGVEGLGFAIPIDTAVLSVNDLLDYGYRRGLPALDATIEDAKIPHNSFFYSIYPCVKDAPEGAPLKEDDLIVAVDGKEVDNSYELKRLLRAQYKIGDTVTLTIYRETGSGYGDASTVQVTLVEYVPEGSVNFE